MSLEVHNWTSLPQSKQRQYFEALDANGISRMRQIETCDVGSLSLSFTTTEKVSHLSESLLLIVRHGSSIP